LIATYAKVSFSAETGTAAKIKSTNAAVNENNCDFITHFHLLPGGFAVNGAGSAKTLSEFTYRIELLMLSLERSEKSFSNCPA
jgi:hypothetical protein